MSRNLNDKLIELSKRKDCYNRRSSETLEYLSDESDSFKTSRDQKTCQILNKTRLIYDKVKARCESLNNNHVQSKKYSIDDTKENDELITVHVYSN